SLDEDKCYNFKPSSSELGVRCEWGFAVKRKNESPTDEVMMRAEYLANLLTLSYEPMLAWRLDGPIEFWNAGAERLYGFPPSEAVGTVSHTLMQTKFPIGFTELCSRLRDARYWSGE